MGCERRHHHAFGQGSRGAEGFAVRRRRRQPRLSGRRHHRHAAPGRGRQDVHGQHGARQRPDRLDRRELPGAPHPLGRSIYRNLPEPVRADDRHPPRGRLHRRQGRRPAYPFHTHRDIRRHDRSRDHPGRPAGQRPSTRCHRRIQGRADPGRKQWRAADRPLCQQWSYRRLCDRRPVRRRHARQ